MRAGAEVDELTILETGNFFAFGNLVDQVELFAHARAQCRTFPKPSEESFQQAAGCILHFAEFCAVAGNREAGCPKYPDELQQFLAGLALASGFP